ncbi:hypothetical protein Mnod_2959 [Methylobacterium nodulans ORS 2060]|uniref:Uncharacterized protein n=1 Tax=Methylobacterium nodulans (strain LMG 21967 / CNCM I-2342 / ORS 2060) TaxID=460265 RepID=B8II40_METNO|nr:hypothetical protein Mnod_2959 [Methylobacterium nodulans ORS 2060]
MLIRTAFSASVRRVTVRFVKRQGSGKSKPRLHPKR